MEVTNNIISVNEQGRDIWYEMELVFKLSVEFTEINDMMSDFGFNEVLGANDAVEIKMHQVIPFVPDNETLEKYCNVIKENYLKENSRFSCVSCRFIGYNYLYAITLKNATN